MKTSQSPQQSAEFKRAQLRAMIRLMARILDKSPNEVAGMLSARERSIKQEERDKKYPN